MTGELTENPFDRNSSSMIYNRDTGQRVSSVAPGSLINWAGEDDGDPTVLSYYDLGPVPTMGGHDGRSSAAATKAGRRISQMLRRFTVHPVASGQVVSMESDTLGERAVLASQVCMLAVGFKGRVRFTCHFVYL